MTAPARTSRHIPPESNPFRVLPQLSRVVEAIDAPDYAAEVVAQIVREEFDRIRQEIDDGARPSTDDVVARCRAAVALLDATRFDEVINGTGIVLHTNLGRAPVSEATARAMASAASSYVSLEIDPATNQRGGRMDEISRNMRLLSCAEATLVVNNNAAALLLTLAALCSGREVIVSRGEAVEIGGGFRIPDVVAQSGCRLVEVGTTNRTYASDYVRAIGPETAALLRVHPSNFHISGFTAAASTAELAAVASEHATILIEDLGSGALMDTARFGLRREPTVSDALGDGASVVTFSGDKLLGGPQAGVICGRANLVRIIERHPLARAVRADKTTLAGIAATQQHYLAGDAESAVPVWRLIAANVESLRERAEAISEGNAACIVPSEASVGGGSLPGETLPSLAISLTTDDADQLARRLRTGSPRVFPIIREGAVLIDMRAVLPRQDARLAQAILQALS